MRAALARVCAAALPAVLAACNQAPPSWDGLISAKLTEQYPKFHVTAPEPGKLLVERPGLPPKTVEVAPIAQYCLRGPRDCDYAIDQLLIELRPPGP